MSFKFPPFSLIPNKEDNRSLFTWFSTLYGRLSSTDMILERVISIGDWDMDATDSVTVNYKATNQPLEFTRIIGVGVTIINDAEDKIYDASLVKDGFDSIAVSNTNITLTRTGSGFFDGTGYNSTSLSTRGYVVVRYST